MPDGQFGSDEEKAAAASKIVELMKSRPERYNAVSRQLLELERLGKVFLIAPDEPLGIKRTEGDWAKLAPIFEEGERIARRDMDKLKAYLAKEEPSKKDLGFCARS